MQGKIQASVKADNAENRHKDQSPFLLHKNLAFFIQFFPDKGQENNKGNTPP